MIKKLVGDDVQDEDEEGSKKISKPVQHIHQTSTAPTQSSNKLEAKFDKSHKLTTAEVIARTIEKAKKLE